MNQVNSISSNTIQDNYFAIGLTAIASLFAFIYSGCSFSVLCVILVIICGIYLELKPLKGVNKYYGKKLLFVTLAVYIFSSLFFSHAFENDNYFLILDARQYFRNLKMTTMDIDPLISLISCYVIMDDLNELHELFYRYCILFANNYLDGANVLYLTLTNTFFGIISLGPIYRILLKLLPANKAYKYSLLFGLLSPFHFYSVTMVRDIVLACLYAHAFELTLDKFKIKNIVLLLIIGIVAWGVRLYSGLFILAFIFYYVFSNMTSSKAGKFLAISSVVIIIVVAVPLALKSDLYKQSSEEIEFFQEYNQDRGNASSLSKNLEALPPGVREISLGLFSQMMPFPCYDAFPYVKSLDHAYIALIRSVFAIFWYFIAFGLIYMLLFGKIARKLSIYNEWILLSLCVIYILLNIVQTDVRRLMAVYPIMFFLYVKCKHVYITDYNKLHVNNVLGALYISLMVVYTVIKGI